MKTKALKIGILGSGSGSNFEAIADAIVAGKIPGAEIVLVVSDKADAPILEKAGRRGLKALHIPAGRYKTWLEPEIEARYAATLKEHGAEWIVLAGFMRVIKQPFLSAFPDRILNVHPSLLPAFPGIAAWKQALDAGAKVTGCTVHFVNDRIDAGPVVLQEEVPVLPGDTPETLHARIQQKEHALFPKVLAMIAEGKIAARR